MISEETKIKVILVDFVLNCAASQLLIPIPALDNNEVVQ